MGFNPVNILLIHGYSLFFSGTASFPMHPQTTVKIYVPLGKLNLKTYLIEVIVKVCVSSAQVPPQEGSVGGKNGSHIDHASPDCDQSQSRLPLMEMRHDTRGLLRISFRCFTKLTKKK